MSTLSNEVTDVSNRELAVGDVCIYIGNRKERGRDEYRGRRVVVRAIKSGEARVDDEIGASDESNKFSWSAWVDGSELAKV